jgi:SAM-dependent methyltransferase
MRQRDAPGRALHKVVLRQSMQTPAFSYSGSELDAMAEARNYYNWILRLAGPYIGTRVVEVGAGVGNFAAALLKEIPVSTLVLVEPADNLFPVLSRRFATEGRVELVKGYLGECASLSCMDSLIAINVIEHVRDDAEFLHRAFTILAPGGTIILFAPALASLCGTLDEAFEHYRRYKRSELTAKLRQARFCLETIRYFNFPGIVTWFLAGKVWRRKTLQPAQVRLYDRWVVPWVSKIERRWEPPIGQSLLAIARKPTDIP